jgi:Lon protease-like protein
MVELPLFPLSSVLFPGITHRLYIFEERYKAMMKTCLEKHQPFGWVLIEEGREAFGPLARPYRVGCTAQIIDVQPLEQGTMNITIVGQERFEIRSLHYDQPYLVGMVDLYPISREKPDRLRLLDARLRPLVEHYLSVLAKVENQDFDLFQLRLPADPVELAYLSIAILQQIPIRSKQALLSVPGAVRLLRETLIIYHREVTLLDMMAARRSTDEPFSLN